MNFNISQRKAFLTEQKNKGQRITIGFTGIADLRSFIALEYIEGMMKAAADYDINFINMGAAIKYSLFEDINFVNHYMKNFCFMKKPFLDGLITWASSLREFVDSEKILETFNNLKPLPMIDIGHLDIPGVTALRIDSDSSVQMIMEHLVKVHGYSKFAFIGADVSEPHRKRLSAYKNELKKYGLKEIKNSVYMANSMSVISLSNTVTRFLQDHDIRKKEIEAIVTTTDIIAAEVINQLEKNGFNVPKDIAVTGFNNWYDGITAKTPVTTINLEYFKRGYMAVELLIDKIMNPNSPCKIVRVKTSLVIRQSCGCFEKSVQNAGKKIDLTEDETEISEQQLRQKLIFKLLEIFKTEKEVDVENLVNSFFNDVYLNPEKSCMLEWFQNHLQKYSHIASSNAAYLQNLVTGFRNIFIPVLKNENLETILRIDGIFHQMRTLITIFTKYETLAERENPYRLNNISKNAVDLSDAMDLDEIIELLKMQLNEMNISKAFLALNESNSSNINDTKIRLIYPEPKEELKQKLQFKIHEPYQFPKSLFMDTRYSLMLEVLHHSDKYFGYIFLEMKFLNIAYYDVIRLLLSNALYSVRIKKADKKNDFLLETSEINRLLKKQNPTESKRNRITIKNLTDYLQKNISEKTNLDKIAEHFMVSRSYLSKKTKELTGCSVQELHEKMKIEQAKKMLLSDNFSIFDVTVALGFANQNYFSNVFKKNTGLSPSNWLKRK